MTPGGRPVIGIVGGDVPAQLVRAAGGLPSRLTGSWTGALDAGAADLLGAADAVVVRLLADVRDGRVRCDGLVVCADSQAHVRLFSVLRSTAPTLPLHLLDKPRTSSPAARRFARFQLRRLASFVSGLSGREPDAAALAVAARDERELAAALERLRDRRIAVPPRCSGSIALEACLEAGRLDPAAAIARLDAARSDVPAAAVRVHLTGSDHPDATLYRVLEEHGCVVVSEDHGTGDGAWLGAAADAADAADLDEAIDRLVELHAARVGGSATASSAQRAELTLQAALRSSAQVVAGVVRELDEAPAWDVPDQSARLGEAGIPLRMRTRVRAGEEVAAARALAGEIVREAASA